jgi:hypothetical protein
MVQKKFMNMTAFMILVTSKNCSFFPVSDSQFPDWLDVGSNDHTCGSSLAVNDSNAPQSLIAGNGNLSLNVRNFERSSGAAGIVQKSR